MKRLNLLRFVIFGWLILVTSAIVSANENDVAIVVGVSDYKSFGEDSGDLRFADKDARMFAEILRGPLKFPRDKVFVFTSHQEASDEQLATSENIRKAIDGMDQVRKVPAKGKFVFYFSGHGVTYKGDTLLACTEYDSAKLPSTDQSSLTRNNILRQLRGMHSTLNLAIFDMCRERLSLVNKLLYSDLLDSNIPNDKTEIGASPTVAIYASNNSQSFEDEEKQQGLFTYYLCHAFKPIKPNNGGKLQLEAIDRDGRVTLASLEDFVKKNVKRKSRRFGSGLAFKTDGSVGVKDEKTQEPIFVVGEFRDLELTRFDTTTYTRSIDALDRYYIYIEDGETAIRAEKLEDAKLEFEKALKYEAIENESDKWEAINGLGQVYIKKEDYVNALLQFKKVKDYRISTPLVYNNYGVALYLVNKDNRLESLANIGRAIELDRNFYPGYNNRALIAYFANTKDDNVAQDLRLSIAINQEYLDAKSNLGGILIAQPEAHEEAERLLREVIFAKPNSPHALYNLGALYLAQSRLKNNDVELKNKAVACFKKSLEYPHAPAKPAYNLGTFAKERYDAERASGSTNNIELTKWGDYAELATVLDPKYAPAWYLRALYYRDIPASNSDDEKEQTQYSAEICFRKAMDLDPSIDAAFIGLAQMLLTKKSSNVMKALLVLEQGVKGKNPSFNTYCLLGQIYMAKQLTKKAGEMFNRAALLESNGPAHFEDIIPRLQATEQWQAMEHCCRKLIKLDPANATNEEQKKLIERHRSWLATALLKQGKKN